jgi:hypothetical protein
MQAMVRENGKLVQREVTLTDLNSIKAFDGKYFKVVKGDSEDNIPVSFDPPAPGQESTEGSPDIRLKAATVYNAFTLSRLYFKKLLTTVGGLTDEDIAYLDDPVTIRLEMKETFSAAVHYNTLSPVFNGAVTIPATKDNPDIKVDINPATQKPIADWGRETWFFAPAEKHSLATAQLIGNTIGQSTFQFEVLESLLSQDVTLAVKAKIEKDFAWQVFAENAAFSIAVSEGAIPILAKFLSAIPTKIYLDAAMLPEIASNEYAHLALYPWLGLKKRTHIVEGYPHYYAAKIWDLKMLQADAKPYSKNFAPRDSTSSVKYSLAQESGPFAATSNFTFSTLAQIDQAFGQDEGLNVTTRAIVTPYFLGEDSPLAYIGPDSNLKTHLTNALLGSARNYGKDPRELDILQLIFHFRQM